MKYVPKVHRITQPIAWEMSVKSKIIIVPKVHRLTQPMVLTIGNKRDDGVRSVGTAHIFNFSV